MKRWTFLALLCLPPLIQAPLGAQPAPRRLGFAEVATLALERNLQLRAAALDLAIAQAALAQARAARQPQLSLQGSYVHLQQPGTTLTFPNPFSPTPPQLTVTVPPPEPNQFSLRLLAQYPLYTGGRLEAQISLAEANVRGAQAALERIRQQVLAQAQQAYLAWLVSRETMTAAQRALAQAEEALRVAQARFRAGTSPRFDVLQAEVSVASARQNLLRAETGVRNAAAQLAAILDLPLDTPFEPADGLEPRPVSGALAQGIAQALERRPELLELRARIEAAQAAVALARSGGRPNLALAANYDLTGPLAQLQGTWSVTLAVTLQIYDGGITRERVREAELRLEQLRVLEAQLRARIELEVRQAWLALEQSGAALRTAEKAVEQAREAARIAAVRFEAGVGTALELLSAQAQLASAESSLSQARFEQNLARLQWLLATGAL
ncbi:MAG: TolC family protein [Armatimonadota bacterium]|nr:TolC family protein [Armatimonadota bacterium]MDR7439618.1 TolC family protein [Armatimonadota bacterium]MDR7562823.1 TolC family protein [Armatimonadota bacterium]MDR7602069.1 TolC family protein [Armatimonadota bacterium]